MPEIYGIDVSKYQGTINWAAVKAAGKEFVFVRLGWAGWDGTISVDNMAETNIKGAAAAGLHVGVYVYAYCKTAEAAKQAAKNTVALIKSYPRLKYPVAFDIEDTSDTGTPYHKYGKQTNSAIAAAYLGEIQAAGYYAMLYTYKSFAENYLDMAALAQYDTWIAHYAEKNGYAGAYGIWQYAGDSGRCSGISGACDLNVSYKDYAALIDGAGLNGGTKPQTAQDVQAATDSTNFAQENEALRGYISKLEAKLKDIATLAALA